MVASSVQPDTHRLVIRLARRKRDLETSSSPLGGLVVVAGEFEDEGPDVADGGEYLWCGACADLGCVFFERHVADVLRGSASRCMTLH